MEAEVFPAPYGKSNFNQEVYNIMWKQYKKEVLAGGAMIAIIAFALGCVFNASTGRGGMTGAPSQIERKADNGCPGNGPGPENGQDGKGQFGHRHGGPGMGNHGPRMNRPDGNNQDNNSQNQAPAQQDPGTQNKEDSTTTEKKNDTTTENKDQTTTENKV